MALQVWLPLNGTLENKGLSNVTVTNNGATVDNNGKIGKCYACKSGNYCEFNVDFGTVNEFSICFWVKIPQTITTAAAWQTMLKFPSVNDTANTLCPISWASYNQIKIFDENNHQHAWITVPYDTWIHYVIVNKWDGTTNSINIYQNGIRYGSYTASKALKIRSGNWSLGSGINSTYGPIYYNDFRVYDHCLSAKEVKEISKGLILHYKLDDVLSPNLYHTTRGTVFTGNGIRWEAISESEWSVKGTKTASYGGPGGLYITENGIYFLKAWRTGPKSTNANAYARIQYNDGTYSSYYNIVNQPKFLTKNDSIKLIAVWPQDDHNTVGTEVDYTIKILICKSDMEQDYIPYSNLNIVYDSSGYCNHGSITGALTTSNDSSRYEHSTKFPDSACSIGIGNLQALIPEGIFTFNIWFKKVTGEWSSKNYETILGGPSGFELEAKYSSTNAPTVVLWNWGKGLATYSLDQWNMVTFSRNSSETKLYLNGELKATGTAGTIPSGDYFIGAWRSATELNYRGYLSDARIYCTALSDDDIKELYNTSAFVTDNGVFAEYELYEDNLSDVKKTGLLETANFYENGAESGYALDTDKTRVASNYIISEEFIEI